LRGLSKLKVLNVCWTQAGDDGLQAIASCAALEELSRRLDFRAIEGFAERMIFREFYPRGLTALADFNEVTLGTRPTMSHATARQEVASLLNSIDLGSLMATAETPPAESSPDTDRHAWRTDRLEQKEEQRAPRLAFRNLRAAINQPLPLGSVLTNSTGGDFGSQRIC